MTGVALALALLGVALSPTAMSARLEQNGAGGGCVSVNPSIPPGVLVDPECAPSSSQSSGMDADATLTGTSVLVEWETWVSVDSVDRFQILRGESPWSLDPIVTTPNSTRSWTDTGAVWSGDAAWYKVIAYDGDGDRVANSRAVLVTPPS